MTDKKKSARKKFLDEMKDEGAGNMERYKSESTDFGSPEERRFRTDKGVIGPYSVTRTKSRTALGDDEREIRERIKSVMAKEDRAAKGVTPAMRKYYSKKLAKEMGLTPDQVMQAIKDNEEYGTKDSEFGSIDSEVSSQYRSKR